MVRFLIFSNLCFDLQRYLGTAREDESLNILLEFVPGGSISSLLGKFGSFPESVCDCNFFYRQISGIWGAIWQLDFSFGSAKQTGHKNVHETAIIGS